MNRIILALALLAAPAAAAPPAFDGEPGWATHPESGAIGICADIVASGAAGVRVTVVGRPELGHVTASWAVNGTHKLSAPAGRGVGLYALAAEHGDGRYTVWIPTTATEPLRFRVEVVSEGVALDRRTLGEPPAAGARQCAALRD